MFSEEFCQLFRVTLASEASFSGVSLDGGGVRASLQRAKRLPLVQCYYVSLVLVHSTHVAEHSSLQQED